MALIDDMKVAVRLMSDDAGLVGEINDLIGAAKLDLVSAGLPKELVFCPDDELDLLLKAAIKLYVKARWGYDNADADRLWLAYFEMKKQIGILAGGGYFSEGRYG